MQSINDIKYSFVDLHLTKYIAYRNCKILRSLNSLFILYKIFKKIDLTQDEINNIKKIEKEIYFRLNVNIDLMKIIIDSVLKFKYDYLYYNKLFLKSKLKYVFLICSYGLEALIFAAQVNKIKVIEIQHGTMSDEHLGYNYNLRKVRYFPDMIFLFGKYWDDITNIPLDNNNKIYYGYPYLDSQLKKISKIKKNKNKIIFISQGIIGIQLSQIAYEFALNNSEFLIDYKLHPSEINIWESIYPQLKTASKLSNFNIINDNQINTYELLAKSEFQVGVNSTLLYEGLAMNLKTILINLPGIEYMKVLIENNYVMLANNSSDILNCIHKSEGLKFNKKYFLRIMILQNIN
ncbi:MULTISPECIES: hypothetical protein [Synergistaceae]|uniref:hypothetical protein n=1 Tax=Synergistaceae TaxID=649777 RepID=UPI003AE43E2B|nr:hypothetical protein [Synergistaceae bacterium DZ-S4]